MMYTTMNPPAGAFGIMPPQRNAALREHDLNEAEFEALPPTHRMIEAFSCSNVVWPGIHAH
jgi:hypothetical protein